MTAIQLGIAICRILEVAGMAAFVIGVGALLSGRLS